MPRLHDFWTQPCRAFRNAQLLHLGLAVAFVGSGFGYCFLPESCAEFFGWMDRMLGGATAPTPEPQNRIWTSLAGANVATLSLMSFAMLADLRKNRAMHLPLLFMKSWSAALFLYWFLFHTDRPSLLVAFVSDAATAVVIHLVAGAALRELDTRPEAPRVPIWSAATASSP